MAFDSPLTLTTRILISRTTGAVTYAASDDWVWCEECDPPIPMNLWRFNPEEDRYEPSPNYSKEMAKGRLQGHQKTFHGPHPKLNPGGRLPSIPESFRYAIFKIPDPRDRRKRRFQMYGGPAEEELEPIPQDATLVREGRTWSFEYADAAFWSLVRKAMKNREYVRRHRDRKRQSP